MKPNRLIKEKSPYLLQHAHNPVDWYPWGEEAFEKARREDKPIFLSIGYSTCHWCHVMEKESFEHAEIAKLMNELVVSIKVDREERPDIDHIYMQAVMVMTGAGGWPMSVFLTHDLKPFYGGTYFPPEDKWGRPGFPSVLKAISKHWKENRENVLKSGEELVRFIQAGAEHKQGGAKTLDEETLREGLKQLAMRFDPEHGGFSHAPKFSMGHTLSFLLRAAKRFSDREALGMVEKTLQEMAKGGMYDQLGGGFHRYSTDEKWHVPHFEKMLYDQALLSKAYLEAYQATRNPEYARIAREIFDYVLRDMTDSSGGFYSAEDADSVPPEMPEGREKKEGAFYVWAEEEIDRVLGKQKAAIFNDCFGVESGGNAEHDPQGEFTGRNILFVRNSIPGSEQMLKEGKSRLFEIRKTRPRPHLDDKVLVDWNGLMISSLALGSRVLNEPRYRRAAEKAAQFILFKMRNKDGHLMRRYRDGESGIEGFLEDYAFLTCGLIDLYEAAFDPVYLEAAQALLQKMIELFWDREHGGFYLTAHGGETLISKIKEVYDGAIPSGNSMAALALLRFGHMTLNASFLDKAAQTLDAFSGVIDESPSNFTQMLAALDFSLGPCQEIVIAASSNDLGCEQMIQKIFEPFLPRKTVVFHPSETEKAKRIEALIPMIKEQISSDGKPAIYFCSNYACTLPIHYAFELDAALINL